jgi:hypothetical protein
MKSSRKFLNRSFIMCWKIARAFVRPKKWHYIWNGHTLCKTFFSIHRLFYVYKIVSTVIGVPFLVCLQQKLTCSNEFRLNRFFFWVTINLRINFLTNQSIFGLWISSHESLKIIGFEGDLMTLNTRLEINLFMCIFKGWVSWVTYLETRVCPSITSHSTRIFLHNSLRYYCLTKFSSTKHVIAPLSINVFICMMCLTICMSNKHTYCETRHKVWR